MMITKLAPIGLLALAIGAAPAQAGPAAGATAASLAQIEHSANVTDVRWRGRHRFRGGRHRFGRGLAIGLGAAIIGGVVANEIYRPRPGYYYDDYEYGGPYYAPSAYDGDPRVLCAENFRSFEWRTGLYTTYAGHKRLCPYLR